jgi:hypothetical protein
MNFRTKFRKVLYLPSNIFETRMPLSPHAMEVRKHDLGGLWWWQSLIEIALNALIILATIWMACRIGPEGFPVLWILVLGFAFIMAPRLVTFRFFTRRPPSLTITCEPACIPPELLHRYRQVKGEFEQLMEEIDRLTVQKDQRHLREGRR